MIQNLQDLVNAQVEVSRVVWAGNLDESELASMCCSFKNDAERLEYIEYHTEQAIKDLQSYFEKNKQNTPCTPQTTK